MKQRIRHPGVTLSEVLVVVAAMVLLTVLAVPATRKIVASFESASGVRRVIAAALANARAIAAKEQCYAGIRFQQDLNGDQYMIFIIHDPADPPTAAQLAADPQRTGTGLANGFRALDGRKPIKLPATVGVADLRLVYNRRVVGGEYLCDEMRVDSDQLLNDQADTDDLVSMGLVAKEREFSYFTSDCSTFSVVFSPAGRLVVHQVWVRNRTGRTGDTSPDDVFNTLNQIDMGVGMFCQDDYPALGFGFEHSRNCFIVYEKKRLEAAPASSRWTSYLGQCDMLYVNPHTGELVND